MRHSLDRGGGYTMPQYRFHFEAHCGMEVLLPSGELMRTGQGAMPGSPTLAHRINNFRVVAFLTAASGMPVSKVTSLPSC